jgi:hypothetical protein
MPKQMHLALDVSWTQVESAWRMPGSWVGPHYPDVGQFEDIARLVERGLFDMIFFGDGSGIPNTWEGGIDAAVRRGVAWPRLDMSPLDHSHVAGHEPCRLRADLRIDLHPNSGSWSRIASPDGVSVRLLRAGSGRL